MHPGTSHHRENTVADVEMRLPDYRRIEICHGIDHRSPLQRSHLEPQILFKINKNQRKSPPTLRRMRLIYC
jgi:hypothetical protein